MRLPNRLFAQPAEASVAARAQPGREARKARESESMRSGPQTAARSGLRKPRPAACEQQDIQTT